MNHFWHSLSAIFIHQICMILTVQFLLHSKYKLRFVLWLRNWRYSVIEVGRSLCVCVCVSEWVGVLCWGDLSRGQPLLIFSPHFCCTHECTLLLCHMIRMQRSSEKESKEKDLIRHSILKYLIQEKRATKQLVSGAGTSEWQPGLPGFLLRHSVGSSQYLPSRVESAAEYRVYNARVLRRSSMTHKDCTECLFFWTHLEQSWHCSHATNIWPVFVSLFHW